MNRTITLCYRKIITYDAVKPWDKLVLEDSFRELKMQAQYYNPEKQHATFSELLYHNPAAENLHFLVSAAVSGYIRQLNEKMPDIANNLGKQFLTFSRFHFEIINSDLRDISRHQVAISFFSDPVEWLDTVGDYLLLAGTQMIDGQRLTHLVQLRPFLSIYAISPD